MKQFQQKQQFSIMFWNHTFNRETKTQTQAIQMKTQMTKTSWLMIFLLTSQAAQTTSSWDQWSLPTQSKTKLLINSYWIRQPLTKLLMRCLKPTRDSEVQLEKNIWISISTNHGLTLMSTKRESLMLKKLLSSWDFSQMTREWASVKTDSDFFEITIFQNYLSYFR